MFFWPFGSPEWENILHIWNLHKKTKWKSGCFEKKKKSLYIQKKLTLANIVDCK